MIAPKSNSTAAPAAKTNSSSPAVPVKPQEKLMALLMGPDVKARLQALMTDKSMSDRFLSVLTGVLRSNPQLAECSEISVVGAMLKSAFLKLEPNNPVTQQCWLIPRYNGKTKTMECSWEIGYKGLIELAHRSGQVKSVSARVIHERDLFDIDFGTNEVIHKLPQTDKFNRGPVVGYWAKWIGSDPNQHDIRLMTKQDMDDHVQQYVQSMKDEKSAKYSPWTTAYNEMALKTVIKKVLKTAPISVEDFVHAITADGMPVTDPKFAPQKMLQATPAYATDPMFASDDLFQHQPKTLDAEYESVGSEQPPAPAAEAKPAAAAPATPPRAPGATAVPPSEETHRQETLAKVRDKLAKTKLSKEELVEKIGMPISMIETATMNELLFIYKAIP